VGAGRDYLGGKPAIPGRGGETHEATYVEVGAGGECAGCCFNDGAERPGTVRPADETGKACGLAL